ncbi:MAG: hypothetical protein WC325_12750 [Candidatus Bathyarchaeia archaeon]|jgi:hypothetical protein
MRRVATALNEQQYKVLEKKLEQLEMTEYELTKMLLLDFLETGTIDKTKVRLFAQMAIKYVIESGKEAIQIMDNAP